MSAELMRRYCEGDREAGAALYRMVAPRLTSHLVKLSGDPATAADITQQTFLKLHRLRDAYVEGANPIPWIFTIARRMWLDELRRQKVRRHGERCWERAEVEQIPAHEPASFGRDPTEIMTLLERLPDSQRQAVLMTKIQGRTAEAVAKVAGTTATAIRLRIHRAYETLRGWLQREEGSTS